MTGIQNSKFITELILDSYKYIPVQYVTMHCMIWPYLRWLSFCLWVQEVSELNILPVIWKKDTANSRSSVTTFFFAKYYSSQDVSRHHPRAVSRWSDCLLKRTITVPDWQHSKVNTETFTHIFYIISPASVTFLQGSRHRSRARVAGIDATRASYRDQ